MEQARQYDTFLSQSASQMESTNNQLKALEKKMEVEHKLYQNMFQETQTNQRRHRHWLLWTMIVGGFVLVLAIR